jgi:hypothetical protein
MFYHSCRDRTTNQRSLKEISGPRGRYHGDDSLLHIAQCSLAETDRLFRSVYCKGTLILEKANFGKNRPDTKVMKSSVTKTLT